MVIKEWEEIELSIKFKVYGTLVLINKVLINVYYTNLT